MYNKNYLYFKKINNLPIYTDLEEEFYNVHKLYQFDLSLNQVCVNTTEPNSSNVKIGVGYLKNGLKEEDFKYIANPFVGTRFEELFNILKKNYNLGRLRIMILRNRSVMRWHHDDTKRIHFPIKTREGCYMVIEDEVMHLKQNQWYLTDTKYKNHTAFNATDIPRIHLVGCIQ